MEGAETSDKASPPLQIDPKCLQEALRAFFQPIKTDDPRLDFYTMYKKEAAEYDTNYVKKYEEDLNTTLIFAGLFSAISSAFVIDVHSNLQPNPNDQSVALLRAILLTLNGSAIPGETSAVPPVQEGPPSKTVIVTCLMYASLIISMLAAFVAMLGKQWLNRYLRNSGGSVIERCGDRQRKWDGLEKWPLHFFVESLPVMLQVSLLLLASGLCRHMWTVNTPVAWTLISLTGLGIVFYIGIVIAGMSSYACPFQTPASLALRGLRKKARCGIVASIVCFKRVLPLAHRMWRWRVRSLLRSPPLPITVPFGNVHAQQSNSWLKSKGLVTTRITKNDDVLCVSWILNHITGPEALDATLPLAGEIRWFDDGVNVNPPYDLIVSTFEACFDSTRRLYPGSRDRAYYSGRAILWIHTLAMCKSEEFASKFPLPNVEYTTPVPDPDLEHLLQAYHRYRHPIDRIGFLLRINPGHTPPHLQWISTLLLHYSCVDMIEPDHESILIQFFNGHRTKTTIHLNTALNRILVWCTFLGSPAGEEALKVQDKSGRTGPILDQLSKVVLRAIDGTLVQQQFVAAVLSDLVRLETTPEHLTEIMYEWCSVIHENREIVLNWETRLLLCLEIGFRRLDFQHHSIKPTITHTEHHRGLVDVVFGSQKSEAIADLLQAWTMRGKDDGQAMKLLGLCAGNLVGLQNLVPSSSRLRRFVIRSVELTEYAVFDEVGVERFIEFLNHLHVTAKDVDYGPYWAKLLVRTILSSEAPRYLSHSYWELLAELAVPSELLTLDPTSGLQTTTSLIEAKEWSRLECWMGVVWMLLPGDVDPTEGNLGHSMTLLFRQRPGAVRKLEQWVERWGQEHRNRVPEYFQQLCKQAHDAAERVDEEVEAAPSLTTDIFLPAFTDLPDDLKCISAPIYHKLIVLHEKHRDDIQDAVDVVLFEPGCIECKVAKALAESRMRTKLVRILCRGVPISVAACVQELGITCRTTCMAKFVEGVVVKLGGKNTVLRS